jgi:hypothetical protein
MRWPITLRSRVRRIRADEGARLRALRLRALADSPLAFGSTLAREEAFSADVWDERTTRGAASEDQVTCVAEDGNRWIGMAVGLVDDPDAAALALVGMFVEPTRGAAASAPRWSRPWWSGRAGAGLPASAPGSSRPTAPRSRSTSAAGFGRPAAVSRSTTPPRSPRSR